MPDLRATAEPLVSLRHISKTFPGTRALVDVSLQACPGEIVAVLGQNGSGKSTLVKVLAGLYEPDPGAEISVRDGNGRTLDGSAARAALHFIHQELALVSSLSTVENLDLGRRGPRGLFSPLRARDERRRARQLIERFGGSFDVDRPLSRLEAAERTIVAIARELSGWTHPTQVLVLDEPTAALHGREADRLLSAVRLLAAEGAGVLYITHRLDEVFRLADRVVVLRDGHLVADRHVRSLSEDELVALIAGKELVNVFTRRLSSSSPDSSVLLRARDVAGESVRRFDLDAHAGEIVGVAGLLGSGVEAVANLLFGIADRTGGTVAVADTPLKKNRPDLARIAGLGLVPADRMAHAAIAGFSVRENLTIARLVARARDLWRISVKRERAEMHSWADQLDLRPRSTETEVQLLSGGNQQKVILARWLRNDPLVLLLDEPTQGVDVGVKASIYDIIRKVASQGRSVVVSSSDAKELGAICDRVLVMVDGRISEELLGESITEAAILQACLQDSGAASAAGHPGGTP